MSDAQLLIFAYYVMFASAFMTVSCINTLLLTTALFKYILS